jgi:branched-chain amino acid transport system permease protein
MNRRRSLGWLWIGLAVLAVIAAPYVLPSYIVSLLTLVFIAALLAASVDLLAGQAGLVSIGHAGIAAAAGYGIAWATVNDHGLAVQLGLALLLTIAVSVVYGLTTMRTRGIVFLMITLALGMVVFGLAFKLSSVTGGQNGLTNVERPAAIAVWWQYYFFTAAVFGLALVCLRVIVRSPFGLMLRGVRASESRMSSLGYPVRAVKFLGVVLSGLFAGLAGVLAVWNSEFISPAAAAFGRSALAVVMVIVGGTGTALGPLVGAGVVVGAEHWLSSYVERWPTVLGLVFIVVVLAAPQGIVGGLYEVRRRVGRRRVRADALAPASLLDLPPASVPGTPAGPLSEAVEEE